MRFGDFKDTEELMKLEMNCENEFKGWWIHELLVEHYAIWASVEYAYKISLLLKKIREEEIDNLANLARKYEDEVKHLTDKEVLFIIQVNELEKKNQEMKK